MGFRIIAKDITVEVDTLEEFRSALDVFRAEGKPKTPSIPKDVSHIKSLPFVDETPTMATQLANFYRHLVKGHALTILQSLYDKPGGLTSEELKNILNVTHGGFGGALAGITKAARPHGVEAKDIISKPKEGDAHYRLTPAIQEVMRSENEKKKLI